MDLTVIGYWSTVNGQCLTVNGYWLLFNGYWLLVNVSGAQTITKQYHELLIRKEKI